MPHESAIEQRLESDYRTLENHLGPLRSGVIRPAVGQLRHPFVDPSSVYRGQLWDWDSYFTVLALRRHLPSSPELARDCVDNFIEHARADGSIPYQVSVEPTPGGEMRSRPADSPLNSAKPVLAQLALLGATEETTAWVRQAMPALHAHVEHWEQTQRDRSGLFTWRSHRGSGADNHPGVYGRPHNSSAGVDLNALFVCEYRALAELTRLLHDDAAALQWSRKADDLAGLVRELLWDPVCRDFFHADVLTTTPDGVTQPAKWVVPLRYRSWVGFYALWSGVADREQASALIQSTFESDDLICGYGIRTLSKLDKRYQLSRSGNPSNWQGPVWVMSNYIVFEGLMNYGYVDEAQSVLAGTLRMLADDIRASGGLHEYYHPDTGHGLTNPGFLGWNLLASTMYAEFAEAHRGAETIEEGTIS